MKAAPLPTSICPACEYEMDAGTCVSNPKGDPSSGDLSICLNCGEMLQFNDILVLKPLPESDFETLNQETKDLMTRASRLIQKRGRFK